ncbi:hypothetical protein H6G27_30680 [Nostoc linckia FACHB-104]|nr:hypothetical protein [Nostoc linckia FACHB-104]
MKDKTFNLSFLLQGNSNSNALGQFLSYRLALEKTEPDRLLYLAIPVDAYRTFFQLEFTQTAVQKYQMFLVVYDPVNEVIVQWIK